MDTLKQKKSGKGVVIKKRSSFVSVRFASSPARDRITLIRRAPTAGDRFQGRGRVQGQVAAAHYSRSTDEESGTFNFARENGELRRGKHRGPLNVIIRCWDL